MLTNDFLLLWWPTNHEPCEKLILTSSDFSIALCQLHHLEAVMKKVAAG